MDTFRYVMAVSFAMMLPPAIGFWFVIHPFAEFWRRRGLRVTYAVVTLAFLAAMAGLYLVREPLLGTDFGTSYGLVALGVPFLMVSVYVQRRRMKHLTFRKLVGVPEILGEAGGGLLTEGIYARIRHPRYLEVVLGMIGWALIINWMGIYVVCVLAFAALHGVVWIEERELVRRFGEAYVEYAARVPRFIPRLKGRSDV